MLSGQAYSFRKKARLAIWLSWISGYTNVYALMVCHILVSHVTGNVTWFARDATLAAAGKPDDIGTINAAQILLFAGLVFAFWIGAVLSGLLTQLSRRAGRSSIYLFPIVAEAVLLLIFALLAWRVGWNIAPRDYWGQLLLGSAAAMAMGVQNATITIISGSVVRTTHLTGIMTDLGIESVQYVLWYRDKTRLEQNGRHGRVLFISSRHPTIQRLGLLMLIICSFTFGTIIGTLAFIYAKPYAMFLPIALLSWSIFFTVTHYVPAILTMDLKTNNSLAPDWPGAQALPDFVGVFKIAHPDTGPEDQAPHFDRWADKLPDTYRVAVLSLRPDVRLDEESVLDIQAAHTRLVEKRTQLIITGFTPRQAKEFRRYGLAAKIGPQNAIAEPAQALSYAADLAQKSL
jgi:uncharacterized membrane protein YoaK (UPF0700 family)